MSSKLERVSKRMVQQRARPQEDGIEGRAQVWDHESGRWVALDGPQIERLWPSKVQIAAGSEEGRA